MIQIQSPNWDYKVGVCNKHSIAILPCPLCMREGDCYAVGQLHQVNDLREYLEYRQCKPMSIKELWELISEKIEEPEKV